MLDNIKQWSHACHYQRNMPKKKQRKMKFAGNEYSIYKIVGEEHWKGNCFPPCVSAQPVIKPKSKTSPKKAFDSSPSSHRQPRPKPNQMQMHTPAAHIG